MSYENEHQHDQHHDYQHDQHHDTHGDHGPDQGAPEHEPSAEAPAAADVSDSARLDAIEAAIGALKTSIDELRAAHTAKPAPSEPAPVAAATTEAEDKEPAIDPNAARFDALDTALADLKTHLGSVSAGIGHVSAAITSLSTNVDSHKDMHSETQSLIDEQQNLMRGLNYIITTAIGTLTSAAKTGK